MSAPTPVRSLVMGLLVAAVLLAPAPLVVAAQTHKAIHSFPVESQSGPFGSLLHASNGKWYGLTQVGPYGKGTIYTLTADGQGGYAKEDVHIFLGGADGESPRGGFVEASDGYLYGVTAVGGATGRGTIYRLDLGGNVSVVHSFSIDEGAFPSALLIESSDGFLYGTTSSDGEHGNGSVFRFDISSGALTVVHAFTEDEGHPFGSLVETSVGVFCGTSARYPESPFPTIDDIPDLVFRLDTAGNLTILHEFVDSNGEAESLGGGLVQATDGFLYGGTIDGGDSDYGTIFRIRPDGTGFESLHSFDGGDGAWPYHSLIEGPDSSLFGVASGGEFNSGAVFRVGPDGSFESLLSFPSDGPRSPSGPLAVDDDEFLGPTGMGPPGTLGTVYRLDESFALTTIHEFRRLGFSYPKDELLQAADGKLYGTAGGVVFRSDLEGNVETVHSFTEEEGHPYGWLTQASDGHLYATTYNYFGTNWGTFYRLSLDGDFTVLHEFTAEESPGTYNLIEASDGYLYGPSGVRVFRLAPAGGPPTIWSLGSIASSFGAPLVESGGAIWGTMWGPPGWIFEVDLQGNYTIPLPYEFTSGGDGCCPAAGFMLGSDGNLYGTTTDDGSGFKSTVFRYEPAGGVLTTLYTFAGRFAGDGERPMGRLLEGGDGFLYGITYEGGLFDRGTVFRVRMAGGDETILHHFGGPGDVDAQVHSGLIRASDGKLYGTSLTGGEYGGGTIYRIDPGQLAPIIAISPDSGSADGGTTITIEGGPFAPGASVWIGQADGNVPSANASAGEALTAIAPALTPGTLNHVFVQNPDGRTGSLSRAWLADFLDVPQSLIFHDAIETLVRNGISVGCGSGRFCPDANVSRAQMAILLLKATQGYAYVPPQPVAYTFQDVHNYVEWIEDLAARGITSGCGGGNYCPDAPVTRDQMAIFLLKALLGPDYVPPTATGIFQDVPPGSFAADWIEDLHTRSITAGCAAAPLRYCPEAEVTRAQMAVFLTTTFGM
jgi:uncharacterized repeat protein (TIGR03803 family)